MLSPARIRDLWAIVHEKFPSFKPNHLPAIGRPGSCGIATPTTIQKDGCTLVQLPTLREISGCCGAGGVKCGGDEHQAGDLYGVYLLANYSPVQKALFTLWLNDNPQCWKSVVTAVSAERDRTGAWSKVELILFEAGFTPVSRTPNRNHGPGHITLWFIELNKSSMLPIPDEFKPEKKVKRAVSSKN